MPRGPGATSTASTARLKPRPRKSPTANDPILGAPLLSISEAYLRVLAAGVARLKPGSPMEAMRVFHALATGRGIQLATMVADDPNVAFWLNLDADRPPSARSLPETQVATSAHWISAACQPTVTPSQRPA